jgi:hypothetical protein
MSRADVQRYLLSDARIAARISEILGRRVAELERRLSDTVFKTAPERIAATLCQLASQQTKRPLGRGSQIALTHEQIAALTGTSRETATKILDDYADRGLVRLGRGKLTILDTAAIAAETGDSPAPAPRCPVLKSSRRAMRTSSVGPRHQFALHESRCCMIYVGAEHGRALLPVRPSGDRPAAPLRHDPVDLAQRAAQ